MVYTVVAHAPDERFLAPDIAKAMDEILAMPEVRGGAGSSPQTYVASNGVRITKTFSNEYGDEA